MRSIPLKVPTSIPNPIYHRGQGHSNLFTTEQGSPPWKLVVDIFSKSEFCHGHPKYMFNNPFRQHFAFCIIWCFNYWKIADIQAHSAAPSATLQACRSAIFERSWKMCASLQVFSPDSMNVLQNILLNQWFSSIFKSRTPKITYLWLRTPI